MKKLFKILLSLALMVTMMPAMTMTAFAEDNVAKIGSTEYATLQGAINAVNNGQIIVILRDVSYDTQLAINNGKTFTIDFENKRFTWTNESVDKDIFTIEGSSNVTVKNMQYKKASNEVKGNRVFKVNSTGKLTLSNMICDSADNIKDTPVRNNGGTVTIDGGVIATTSDSTLYLLNPVVQNLGGTTTFKGDGTYTLQQNTGAAWLGTVITTPDPSANPDTNCGTVIIENGTFNTGHIVDVNGKGNITINNAIHSSNAVAIKTFHGGIKSKITVNNITTSALAFAQLVEELQTKINLKNGNVKYMPTRFCIDVSGNPMTSVSIKNGKFGPKTGSADIHDEIQRFLVSGATLTALSGDPDGYTYKVESQSPTPPPTPPAPKANKVLLCWGKTFGSRAIKLSWNKVPSATKYVVYGQRCGIMKYKKLKVTRGKSYTVKNIGGKNLKAHNSYKFYVVAYKGNRKVVTSKYIHLFTDKTCGKYANATSIKVSPSKKTIRKGKKFTLKVATKIYKNKKHITKNHGVATRFISNKPTVASVNTKGVITAKKVGVARIYVQDIGGLWKSVKVTVKNNS